MKTASVLIRNFVILFFGNVLGQVLFLFGMILLARRIGPEAFGWWSFAQALALYLMRAGEFGLEVTGIRAVAKDESLTKERTGEVLALRMLLACALVLLTALAVTLNLVPSEAVPLVLMFSLAVFPVGMTVEWLYEAKQQVAAISVARILKGALFFLLVVLVVHEPSDVVQSAAAYVVSLAIPSVALLVLARQQFQVNVYRVSISRSRELLVEAWPLAVATVLSQYSLFFGTTMLGYRASGEEVGLYSAAHRLIIFVWAYGITTAHRILLPSFSQLQEVSQAEFPARLLSAVRMAVLAAVPVGFIGSSVATEMMQVLFGVGFEAAGSIFRILVWALVIGMVRSPFDVGLLASSRQSVYLRGMLILGVAHTVFDSAGYLLGGLEGLAVGVLGAEIIYAVFLAFQYDRSVVSGTLRLTLKPVVAGVCVAVVLSMLQLPWGVLVIMGFVLYAIVLISLGEFSSDDRKHLKKLLGVSTERIS